MKTNHVLSSGILIRQDIKDAIRFVFFDTGINEYRYATHGGTSFLVNFKGRTYAITAKHVLQDFQWPQLVVTDTKFGQNRSSINSVCFPSDPTEDAQETDIEDIAILPMNNDAAFYQGSAYILDEATVCSSNKPDVLLIAGALKEKSIIYEHIKPVFAGLECQDNGYAKHDPVLRHAIAKFDNPELTTVEGLSGSPVFNVTQNALAGMVVRGSVATEIANFWYIDIFDILKFLNAIHEGKTSLFYKKTRLIVR